MPAAYVRLRGAASRGQTLAITDELLLGRELLKEFEIADAKVSRRHARLFVTPEGRVWVEDLGSTNGTFLNGERVERAPVNLGDQVRVGTTTLELVAASQSAPPAAR